MALMVHAESETRYAMLKNPKAFKNPPKKKKKGKKGKKGRGRSKSPKKRVRCGVLRLSLGMCVRSLTTLCFDRARARAGARARASRKRRAAPKANQRRGPRARKRKRSASDLCKQLVKSTSNSIFVHTHGYSRSKPNATSIMATMFIVLALCAVLGWVSPIQEVRATATLSIGTGVPVNMALFGLNEVLGPYAMSVCAAAAVLSMLILVHLHLRGRTMPYNNPSVCEAVQSLRAGLLRCASPRNAINHLTRLTRSCELPTDPGGTVANYWNYTYGTYMLDTRRL